MNFMYFRDFGPSRTSMCTIFFQLFRKHDFYMGPVANPPPGKDAQMDPLVMNFFKSRPVFSLKTEFWVRESGSGGENPFFILSHLRSVYGPGLFQIWTEIEHLVNFQNIDFYSSNISFLTFFDILWGIFGYIWIYLVNVCLNLL